MLLYSISMAMTESFGTDDFIALAIEWNRSGSFAQNIIPDLNWNGQHSVRFGTEDLWMGIEEVPGGGVTAVRYEKRDPGGQVWHSDFVFRPGAGRMTVRLSRDMPAAEPGVKSRYVWSPPFFPRLLIDHGFVRPDGDLPVLHTAVPVGEEDSRRIGDVIRGKTRYALPVVYVSRTCRNELPVRAGNLAYLLKGAAHVLAAESNRLDRILRLTCDGRNEYGGSVGVYFPDGSRRRFRYTADGGPDDAQQRKVFGAVNAWWRERPLEPLSTWEEVSALLEKEEDRIWAGPEETASASLADREEPAPSGAAEDAPPSGGGQASPPADAPEKAPSGEPSPRPDRQPDLRERLRGILRGIFRRP